MPLYREISCLFDLQAVSRYLLGQPLKLFKHICYSQFTGGLPRNVSGQVIPSN
jgi:hypothetical protein